MSLDQAIINAPALDQETEAAPKIKDTFVYMDNVEKILEISLKTGKNVILYGPGGHGKSDYAMGFLNERDIDPYVITMGTGMTTDRLFGGLDIATFNSTGKIEYLVDNSFMNHKYVIFEELFDAPDFILEQLKDILSSGVFRNGNQVFPINTEVIICCTNKTRAEFSKNSSLKALMERFPLEHNVVWKDYTRITYENLLKTHLGFSDPMLTYILEQYAAAGSIVSPRIAVTAANIIDQCGPEALTFIADFNAKPQLLKESLAKFESIKKITDLAKELEGIVLELGKEDLKDIDSVKRAGKLNKSLHTKITSLKSIKADDSLVTTSAEAIKKFTAIYEGIKKKLAIITAVDE